MINFMINYGKEAMSQDQSCVHAEAVHRKPGQRCTQRHDQHTTIQSCVHAGEQYREIETGMNSWTLTACKDQSFVRAEAAHRQTETDAFVDMLSI